MASDQRVQHVITKIMKELQIPDNAHEIVIKTRKILKDIISIFFHTLVASFLISPHHSVPRLAGLVRMMDYYIRDYHTYESWLTWRPSVARYVMRVPEDGQWGVLQEGGLWTGTVGTLQRRLADFSMLLNWSSKRLNVMDFSRIYAAEPLVIVSTQPRPRPHYLALVAPFTG